MSVTYQIEDYAKVIIETSRLYESHYQEIAEHKDEIPLLPDYGKYYQLALSGKLFVVTVRDNGEVIGYFYGVLDTHLHYRTSLTLTTDLYYLKPEYRKQRVGYNLFKYVIEQANKLGVQRFYIGCKVKHDVGHVFERLGFNLIERQYAMLLQGGKQ